MPVATLNRAGSRVLHRPTASTTSITSFTGDIDVDASNNNNEENTIMAPASSSSAAAPASIKAGEGSSSSSSRYAGLNNAATTTTPKASSSSPSAGRSMIARLPSMFRRGGGVDRKGSGNIVASSSSSSIKSPPSANTHSRSFSSSLPRPTNAATSSTSTSTSTSTAVAAAAAVPASASLPSIAQKTTSPLASNNTADAATPTLPASTSMNTTPTLSSQSTINGYKRVPPPASSPEAAPDSAQAPIEEETQSTATHSRLPAVGATSPPRTSSPSPATTNAIASAASTPSRIPSLAKSSPLNTAASARPSGINTSPEVPTGPVFRSGSIFSPTGTAAAAAATAQSSPTNGSTSSSSSTSLYNRVPGLNAARQGGSSGIPRFRTVSETAANPPALNSPVFGNLDTTPSSKTHRISQSVDAPPAPSSSSSEASRGASVTRAALPQTIQPSATTQAAQSHPDSSVPPMWRSTSYEGSTKAYLNSAPSTSTSASTPSTSSTSNTPTGRSLAASARSSTAKLPIIGLRALEDLEAKYNVSSSQAAADGGKGTAVPTDGETENGGETSAIVTRIKMLRKLVELRGERVLENVDVEKVVWLEGTNLHLTPEQELAQARNGSVVSNAASPLIGASTSANVPHEKKQGLLEKVTSKLTGHTHQGSHSSATANGEMARSESAQMKDDYLAQQEAQEAEIRRTRGPIFGVKITDGPPLAYAVSIIGGQRHQLPILVFSLVEAIFRRGLDTSGIFRMNGNPAAINRLVEIYNTYPSYGDDINLEHETIFTLCDLLKRYLKDLPEPVLSKELWTLFIGSCLMHTGADEEKEHARKLAAAQIVLRLLPRKNTSLLIYLIAFLFQLPLHPQNRLTIESISVIFGPGMLAPRQSQDNVQSNQDHTLKRSQEGLKWLLDNWDDSLSQDLLDEEYDCLRSPLVGEGEWDSDESEGEEEDEDEDEDEEEEEEDGELQRGNNSLQAVSEDPPSPDVQHLPERAVHIVNPQDTPALSMIASPMAQNFSQESEVSAASSSEGWGRALSTEPPMSPSEDNAARARVVNMNRARKSSFNLDPAFPSPTKSEFGAAAIAPPPGSGEAIEERLPGTKVDGRSVSLSYKPSQTSPVQPNAQVFQQDYAEPQPESSTSEMRAATSPGLRSTKSERSLKSVMEEQKQQAAGSLDAPPAMPGNLPIYSPAMDDASHSNSSTVRPSPTTQIASANSAFADPNKASYSDRSLPPVPRPTSPETVATNAFTDFSERPRQTSSAATSFRDAIPLHSRKESSASATVSPLRNGSYSGIGLRERPTSASGRSEAASDIGSSYFPDEIASDPNAARLFGSLGELFATERRKVSEHQSQLKSYENRISEQEEHVLALHREVLDRESHTRQLENEVAELKRSASQQQAVAKANQELEATLADTRKRLQEQEEARKQAVAELETAKQQEKQRYEEEIARLKAEIHDKSKERDVATNQLSKIR